MAEGVAVGGQVAAGIYDDPDSPPAPDPVRAPKGWTWQRSTSSWQPALRQARGRGAVPPAEPDVSRETQPAAPGAAGDVSRETLPGADADPAPAWLGERGGAGADVSRETPGVGAAESGRIAFEDVPETVKDDIIGLVGLVAVPILSLVTAVDPYCGGVLSDCLDPAMQAALPLICRSSRVVAYFADEANDWLLWGKLALALKPLGTALVEHHILGRVHVVRDPQTGARTVIRGPVAAQPGADHLTPPVQPEYRYAA